MTTGDLTTGDLTTGDLTTGDLTTGDLTTGDQTRDDRTRRAENADDGSGGHAPRYALGHSAEEIDRLETQARIMDPITRRFWERAGVRPGMRVLDVGCGAGHTTRLLAELVGPHGHAVGLDNAEGALAAARAAGRHLDTVSYRLGDPGDHDLGGPFDAVVGRYVLMFQPDPASFLAAAARHARPGGVVAFHELAAHGITSRPPVPTFDRVTAWNAEATRRYGADPDFGARLYGVFLAAGLPDPELTAAAVHGRGAASLDVLTQVRNLTRSLLAELERFGIADAATVGIDTLLDRMRAEATATDSVVVGHLQIGASCTV